MSSIQGLEVLKRLETLSWREQNLESSGFPEIQYQGCRHVQNLYLSNSMLTSFAPSTPFLNLRNLELASTGLKGLSPDFGRKLPNLQILNLNYNAVRDLRPLLGIARLEKLFVAGNRISRLRQTATVLERLGKHLTEVDLRRNPLTVGFYTPQESISAPTPQTQIILQPINLTANPACESSSSFPADTITTTDSAKAHLLPSVDRDVDALSRARLDQDTQLRRRVYEMLIRHACARLLVLDGLRLDGPEGYNMVAGGSGDGVWKRLLELGVLNGEKGRGK